MNEFLSNTFKFKGNAGTLITSTAKNLPTTFLLLVVSSISGTRFIQKIIDRAKSRKATLEKGNPEKSWNP
jgi:hypothetical protein